MSEALVYLRISQQEENGWIHVECFTDCGKRTTALSMVSMIYHAMTDGRNAVTRHLPEVETEKDFETRKVHNIGRVRFSFKMEPGTMKLPEPETDGVRFYGLGKKP